MMRRFLFAVGRFEQAFEGGALRGAELIRAFFLEAFFTKGLGMALGFHHEQFIARLRQTGESEDLHRSGGAGFFDRFAVIVEERFHFAAVIAANERVADLERADLHDHSRGRSAARFDLSFNHRPARRGGGR